MKKTISLLMLLVSITANLCAQTSQSDKAFEVPANIIINRRFYIDLDKGNRLKIELSDFNDLQRIANTDSLLHVFWQDITPLQDSLSDPLTSKRIDYVTDAQGRKKIRFQQFAPKGASFLLQNDEAASLRTEQDTIHIIGVLANPSTPKDNTSRKLPRYYHLTFYINEVHELDTYANGILNEKIAIIQQHVTDKWPLILGGGSHYLAGHREIWADRRRGQNPAALGDFVNAYITLDVQNYKNYFVPSFTVGARFVFTNREHTFKWQPAVFWEPHFFFDKDNAGKLRTYRNDFLTLSYGQGGTTDYDVRKNFSFSSVFSLGYLIYRQGDFVDKNTFRLGIGNLSLNKAVIEPAMYFNNFFRGVTPGVKISLGF